MEQEIGANTLFTKNAIKFTGSNWWQETEKMTEHHSSADFFLVEERTAWRQHGTMHTY